MGRLAWAVGVAALLLFLAFGSATLRAGDDEGDVVRLRDLAAALTETLELRGLASVVVLFVWVAAAVAIAAATWALWLAASVRDDPPAEDAPPA